MQPPPNPLLGKEGGPIRSPSLARRGSGGGSDVHITDASDPDRLVLEADLAADGVVVVADTYYPGWKAYVDGAPVEISPADVLFRAVSVPAGKHTIEFRYQPASFRIGVVLFVLGALTASVSWIYRRRSPTS